MDAFLVLSTMKNTHSIWQNMISGIRIEIEVNMCCGIAGIITTCDVIQSDQYILHIEYLRKIKNFWFWEKANFGNLTL